jgi:hypothetical protein
VTCKYRYSNSSDLLSCMGLTPLHAESEVTGYANRVHPVSPGNYAYFYVLSCLRVNRLIRPDIPDGPCQKLRQAPTGAQQLFGVVGGLSSNDPEPISRAIIQGVGAVGSFFSALFSGAPSAKELQTQCDVVNGYNAFADAVESALRSGQITLPNAVAQLTQVHDQLTSMLRAVEGGTDSAPYYIRVALDALRFFNVEVVYPANQPAFGTLSFFSSAPGAAPRTLGGIPGGLIAGAESFLSVPLAAVGINLSSGMLLGLTLLVALFLVVWVAK